MLTRACRPALPARLQRGLSLVEMMVGVTVGLIVVAGASLLMSAQLGDNRRLLIETQLQQDLRASMDIITRELRRTGTQTEPLALAGVWDWSRGAAVAPNPHASSPTASADGVAVSSIGFSYQPGGGRAAGPFGFRLSSGGVVQSEVGASGWQDLTDPNVLQVTRFTVTPRNSRLSDSPMLKLSCPKLCDDGTAQCWPEVQVREFEVAITARARTLPEVTRSIASTVRLRNDYLRFNNGPAAYCPA